MIVDGIKYACATCVKGHRSSICQHADRPLVQIRRKGRPVSQCGYCRDLRKTRQVHVKCVCKSKRSGLAEEREQKFAHAGTDSSPCRQHTSCTCPGKPATKKTTSPSAGQIELPPLPTLHLSSSILLHRRQQQRDATTSTLPVVHNPSDFGLTNPVSSSTSVSPPVSASLERQLMDRPDFAIAPLASSLVPPSEACAAPSLDGWGNIEQTSKLMFPTQQCGSLVPHSHCSASWDEQGQSVVVTLTPIPKSGHQGLPTPITNIVTCYCGVACNCPGCLVHPNPTFLPASSTSTYSSSDDGHAFSPSSSSSCA